MIMGREIQEAQENLLQKREGQNQITNLTPLISSDDNVVDIVERARLKHDGRSQIPEEKPAPIHRYIPPAYRNYTFENFKGGDRYIEMLKKWNETNDNICIMGITGSGKTHLAIAIYRDRDSQREAKFITIPDLLLKIRGTFRDDSVQSEEGIVIEYTGYPLLVLDDLGAEKTSEYSIATLYLILDRRIRHEKQTIITTNLSLQEIEDTLGARIASRIAGMRNIKLNMPDFRKKR